MNILYYYWGETSKEDCIECMKELGWMVECFSLQAKDLAKDDNFKEVLRNKLLSLPKTSAPYDCVFSFDYFPLISEVCQDMEMPYISWVYDSPHWTLQSVTLGNPCNHIYLFDYGLVERYRSEGFDTVDYMPLACNIKRLDRICSPHVDNPKHDITFLGSLYNDENNFYDQIKFLPDYLKGFLDAIIASQPAIYGLDLPGKLMSDEICAEMAKYVQADFGEGFRSARNEILRNMLRKKITSNERQNLLHILGDRLNVDLYAPAKPPTDIHVNFKGYASYRDQMPLIFASSKININITLRSILTGIPLRVVDILGARGFVLSNYQAELAEYFEYGKSIVWFDSPGDLVEKCAYYLEHDDERKKIATLGHEIAANEFAYEVLLPKIFNIS